MPRPSDQARGQSGPAPGRLGSSQSPCRAALRQKVRHLRHSVRQLRHYVSHLRTKVCHFRRSARQLRSNDRHLRHSVRHLRHFIAISEGFWAFAGTKCPDAGHGMRSIASRGTGRWAARQRPGVRWSSTALERAALGHAPQGGRGLPHSRTLREIGRVATA